ncbi:MAG: alpha/beta fold hydrolase, partial [Thermosynechococcaceae cyanobacterium]
SPLYLLPKLRKPTLMIYAADDPMFDPTLIPDLQNICAQNPAIDLVLTDHGGHVGYLNSAIGQRRNGDCDSWWAWNRTMEWFEQQPLP